jgi:hypothetical protein
MQKLDRAFHERVALDLLARDGIGVIWKLHLDRPTLIVVDIRVAPRSSSRPPMQPNDWSATWRKSS